MRSTVAIVSLSALTLALVCAAAQAQKVQKLVDVRVQYSLQIPLEADDAETQSAAMEKGRKQLYDMGAKECALMLATISSNCRLEGLNIEARVQPKGSRREPMLNLSASARFKVELKPEP